jgi:alcohol dehydrogenase
MGSWRRSEPCARILRCPQADAIDKDEWFRLLPLMAEQALASGSPTNHPVVPTVDEIQDLYAQIHA